MMRPLRCPFRFSLRSSMVAPMLVLGWTLAVEGLVVDGLAAQASVVVPHTAAGLEGGSVEPFLLGGFERRLQLIIARSELQGLKGRPIRRIVLRRDAATNARLPAGMQGGWIDLEVRASWSVVSPNHPSAVFARNHSIAQVTAYRGPFQVTRSPQLAAGRTVATFAPSESAHIVLQKPIPWRAAGDLCLEFLARPHATLPLPGPWFVDSVATVAATRTQFGHSCWRPGHKEAVANTILRNVAVGGTLRAWTTGPTTPLALFVLGASNRTWGPIPLPMDLAGVGAPGCLLYVSQDIVVGRAATLHAPGPDATASFDLPIPYRLSLAGARVYTQWVFYDPKVNAAGLSVTNGASVRIAAAPKLGVSMVAADRVGAKTGRTLVGSSLVFQLASR